MRGEDHVDGRRDDCAKLALVNPIVKDTVESQGNFLMVKEWGWWHYDFSIPEFTGLIGFREFCDQFVVSVAPNWRRGGERRYALFQCFSSCAHGRNVNVERSEGQMVS